MQGLLSHHTYLSIYRFITWGWPNTVRSLSAWAAKPLPKLRESTKVDFATQTAWLVNAKSNSNSIQSSINHRPPPTTSTQHQPWIFLGTQARWSRNSASIHSGLPGKAHQDAKTCSFSQVLGGFHLGRWDRTTSKLITGHANLNEVETKIAKPKMCQTCPILFSKTAKMHVKRDHYGIYGPISTKSLHLLRDHSRHLNQSS